MFGEFHASRQKNSPRQNKSYSTRSDSKALAAIIGCAGTGSD